MKEPSPWPTEEVTNEEPEPSPLAKFFGACLGIALILSLPVADFLLIVRGVYVASVPYFLSPFVALPLGIVAAILFCALFLCSRDVGNSLMEKGIAAVILFVLLVTLYPIPDRIRSNAARRHTLEAQRARTKLQKTAPLVPSRPSRG